MKYNDLIENVTQLEREITKTEHVYFESVEQLREVREDLSKLDINHHLLGVIKPFLIEWGNMARVVGREGLDWEGFSHKIQELAPNFNQLRDNTFLSIYFSDKKVSTIIKIIYSSLGQYPYLGGSTTLSKVLHLLNPEIFVMWDDNIKEVYHEKNHSVNIKDQGYLEFLKESQKEINEAISDFQKESGKTTDEIEQEIRNKFRNKTLARIVDEYNYFTYTFSPNEPNNVSESKSVTKSNTIVTQSKNTTRMIPDPNKPLNEYICNPEHSFYATKCMILLKNFPGLKVVEGRCHGKEPHTYTCWYVSFKNKPILNLTIKKSNVNVEFRKLKHTPNIIGVWHWVLRDKMKGIFYNDYTESELRRIINAYLKNLKEDSA